VKYTKHYKSTDKIILVAEWSKIVM